MTEASRTIRVERVIAGLRSCAGIRVWLAAAFIFTDTFTCFADDARSSARVSSAGCREGGGENRGYHPHRGGNFFYFVRVEDISLGKIFISDYCKLLEQVNHLICNLKIDLVLLFRFNERLLLSIMKVNTSCFYLFKNVHTCFLIASTQVVFIRRYFILNYSVHSVVVYVVSSFA